MRVYPLLALWLFLVAAWDLRAGRPGIHRAKLPFFAGVGFLSYALLRFLLQHAFGQAVFWANAWEELTELFTVLSLLSVVWVLGPSLSVAGDPAGPQGRRLSTETEPAGRQ